MDHGETEYICLYTDYWNHSFPPQGYFWEMTVLSVIFRYLFLSQYVYANGSVPMVCVGTKQLVPFCYIPDAAVRSYIPHI